MKMTCISGTLCLHYSTYYIEFNVALLAIFLTVNEDLEHDISPLCRQHLVQFSARKGKLNTACWMWRLSQHLQTMGRAYWFAFIQSGLFLPFSILSRKMQNIPKPSLLHLCWHSSFYFWEQIPKETRPLPEIHKPKPAETFWESFHSSTNGTHEASKSPQLSSCFEFKCNIWSCCSHLVAMSWQMLWNSKENYSQTKINLHIVQCQNNPSLRGLIDRHN